jgi:hypothetical protein
MHAPRLRAFLGLLLLACACSSSDGSSGVPEARDALALDSIPAKAIGPTIDVADDAEPVIELATDSLRAPVHPQPRFVTLEPAVDSVAKYMVFAARGQSWYTAAARAKRITVDIGRYDAKLIPAQMPAFREAIDALSPVKAGDRFRLYGPWGSDTVVVSGFEVHNSRIVATLDVPPRVDSIARKAKTLVAGALRTDSAGEPVTAKCARDSVPEEVWLRAGFARDSLEQALRDASVRLPERLQHTLRVETSHAIGCFAQSRMVLVVTLLGGNYEYVRQGAVAVSDSGVTPLAVLDPRFRAHYALHALDADGDGIDDLAMRGRAERMGATVVLRYNWDEKRLERLATGFAWERN